MILRVSCRNSSFFIFSFYNSFLCDRSISLPESKKYQQTLHDKHRRARQQCHCDQAFFFVGCNEGYKEACCAGDDAVCGFQDGREGHGCQTGIWHVVQKGLDKRTSDLIFCKSKGQHTDEIGDCCHHQDIEIYVMTHEMLPPSLPPGRNRLPGLLPEVL